MMYVRSAFLKSQLWVLMAVSSAFFPCHADEYADASRLVRANKFAEALVKVDSYLATKPADPQMRFLKGVTQRNLGRQAEAIVTFTKLTEDYPELPEPYNNLAVLFAGQGQYDKARVALEVAIRTNPGYATAHENLGDIYARLAGQAYNKALQLDSSNQVVPPKLALVREVFKSNQGNARQVATATAQPSSVATQPVFVPASVASSASFASKSPVILTQPIFTASSPASPAVLARPPVAVASALIPNVKTSQAMPVPDAVKAPPTVEESILAWAQAWSTKDMSAHLKAYSPDFIPGGKQSRSAWEHDRYKRIMGKSPANVQITRLRVKVKGDVAQVKFRQTYKSGASTVSSRKTMDLRKSGTRWLITRESTGR
jgi:Flp pilus assembly protein TadD/ketosteroid isomerase-like protein